MATVTATSSATPTAVVGETAARLVTVPSTRPGWTTVALTVPVEMEVVVEAVAVAASRQWLLVDQFSRSGPLATGVSTYPWHR